MRRTSVLAFLCLATILIGACSSSATTAPIQAPVDHYRSTPAPYYPPQAAASAAAAGQIPAPTPYYDVTFQNPGVNPYISTAEDNQSTFGLDVDTASYTVARKFVSEGNMPDPNSIRVEEWVNYFDQGYPAPETGAFGIYADGGPTPFLSPSETLLRIGIKARDVSSRQRPSAALTFVIDVSGSMADGGRLELVKESLKLLVDQLRADDSVAIVVFSTDARVVLGPTSGGDRATILSAIGQLQPEQTTNVQAGLELGYGLARETLRSHGINRVVLASDGVANVGLTDSASILASIHADAEAGIQLVSVGVGMGNYNDTLLEALADKGDGFYAYIDTPEEAHRLFVEELTTTLDTVALDARVQVDFNQAVVAAYRLIGFENRAIPDQQFRNDDVEAGAIGAGHEVTALYAVVLNEGYETGRIASVDLRWTDPQTKKATEIVQDVDRGALARDFRATDEHFKLDACVAATAEVFRDSPWIPGWRFTDVVRVTDQIALLLPKTDDVHDFLELVNEAVRLDP